MAAPIFNADDALAMAEQVERNGRAFYLRAAEVAAEPEIKKLLGDLAAWEEGHQALFAQLRAGLSDREKKATTFDPEGVNELYLQAMADTHVFTTNADPAAIVADGEDPDQILLKALAFERDSIALFLGIAKMVPERLGRDKVERIIEEEVGHIAYLNRLRQKLRNA